MTFTDLDYTYMRRALQLAALGAAHVSPNPMVGAVIVDPSGRIIGEGWHRRYGGPHAEVNAVRSVAEADRSLFGESTMYVTLEPCSHYGKTPPCAALLVDIGIGRVVVGAGDPNPKVAGRGIAMLRDAGVEVDQGLLADESRRLNRTFMTAQTLRRPYVTLKWARSADGFLDCRRSEGEEAARFSTVLTSQIVHRRRAMHDAIAVGAGTVIADNPRLDVRLLAGRSPRPVIFDRQGLVDESSPLRAKAVYVGADRPLADTLASLFADQGITSILVEGGAGLLNSFIAAGLWDEAYEEIAPCKLGSKGSVKAPVILAPVADVAVCGDNEIVHYIR